MDYLCVYLGHFFSITHVLSSFWISGSYRGLPPLRPVLAFIFYRAYSIANPRARAFAKSNCAQEKAPRTYTSMHWGGFELTNLTHTRLDWT